MDGKIPLVLFSIFISVNALAKSPVLSRKCSDVVQSIGERRSYYDLAFKNIPYNKLTQAQMEVIFSVRDRLANGATIIRTQLEEDVFTRLVLKPVRVGSKITASDFYTFIMQANYRLVLNYAYDIRFKGHDKKEVIQAAEIGLWKALQKYDPKKGALSTFADEFIKAEINEYILSTPTVKIYGDSQHSNEGRRAMVLDEELTRALGRRPTDGELVDAFNRKFPRAKKMTEGRLQSIREREAAANVVSASEENLAEWDFPVEETPELIFDRNESPQRLAYLFKKADLTPQQIRYLTMYYGLPMTYVTAKGQIKTNTDEVDMTMEEIAHLEGLRKQSVHNAISKALKTLKEHVPRDQRERLTH